MPLKRLTLEAPPGGKLITRKHNGKGQHSNVERYIRREEELVQARDYCNKSERTAICANWEERLLLRKKQNFRLDNDLDILNTETIQVRQKRLLKFYQSCYDQWEIDLNKNGLAILRDRD